MGKINILFAGQGVRFIFQSGNSSLLSPETLAAKNMKDNSDFHPHAALLKH